MSGCACSPAAQNREHDAARMVREKFSAEAVGHLAIDRLRATYSHLPAGPTPVPQKGWWRRPRKERMRPTPVSADGSSGRVHLAVRP
jgi:hypothetical protein